MLGFGFEAACPSGVLVEVGGTKQILKVLQLEVRFWKWAYEPVIAQNPVNR